MGMDIQGNIISSNGSNPAGAPVDISEAGVMFEQGLGVVTYNSVASVSYLGSDIASGIILREGLTAATADNLPTAANILAAFFGANGTITSQVFNASRRIRIINNNADSLYTLTLNPSTGVTISGSAVINGGAYHDYLLTIGNGANITLTYIGGGTF